MCPRNARPIVEYSFRGLELDAEAKSLKRLNLKLKHLLVKTADNGKFEYF